MALLRHPPPTARDLAYYNAPAIDTGEPRPSGHARGRNHGRTDLRRSLADPAHKRGYDPAQDGEGLIPVSGDLLAVVPRYPEYSFGERLSLVGRLTVPPRFDTFDYAAYLAHLGVYSYLSFPKATSFGRSDDNWLAGLVVGARASARSALQRAIAEPQASLAVGVVLGDRSSMPPTSRTTSRHRHNAHPCHFRPEYLAARRTHMACCWRA